MGPAFPLHLPVSESLICLGLAWAWDRWLGEPRASVHPVVWMGKLIQRLTHNRPAAAPARELRWGAVVAFAVPAVFWVASAAALLGLEESPILRILVSVWLLKSSFALGALANAALVVRDALESGDLPRARVALGSLCSRDASELSEEEVAAAAVESVAENASDSVVAPLFYFLLFGIPGALFYRAVNTADAMIGYRGRYEYLGKVAARLDDVLNLVPARLTALLLLGAGWLQGLPVARGFAIWRRDAGRTQSPNAGHPMAAMAGLLGVRLTKAGHYTLGDEGRSVDVDTVARATRVLDTLGWMVLVLVGQGMFWLAR
ncbi:MAG TPA: adenosylcobinamide-phosphate synthase CbiB [Polyangia bacterium]